MTKPRNYVATSVISIPLPGIAPNAEDFENGDFSYSEPFDFAPVIAERFRDRIKAMWPAYEAKARELGLEPDWRHFQSRAQDVLAVADAAKLQKLDKHLAENIAINAQEQHDGARDVTAVSSAGEHDPDLARLCAAFNCKPEDLEPSEPESREAPPDWIEARLRGGR